MVFSRTPSILITDDDLGFRQTLRGLFEPQGFRTIEASDGQEALDILDRGEDVHLLLIDMHMPRLTGLETLQRVRQTRWKLPCILLSANLDEQIIQQAQLAHAFSVLSKPVTRSAITDSVTEALRRTYGW